jgi:hypothetical protein
MVDYTTNAVTVTLDRPDSPQVAHASGCSPKSSTPPATMLGDHRPLTYQLTDA